MGKVVDKDGKIVIFSFWFVQCFYVANFRDAFNHIEAILDYIICKEVQKLFAIPYFCKMCFCQF